MCIYIKKRFTIRGKMKPGDSRNKHVVLWSNIKFLLTEFDWKNENYRRSCEIISCVLTLSCLIFLFIYFHTGVFKDKVMIWVLLSFRILNVPSFIFEANIIKKSKTKFTKCYMIYGIFCEHQWPWFKSHKVLITQTTHNNTLQNMLKILWSSSVIYLVHCFLVCVFLNHRQSTFSFNLQENGLLKALTWNYWLHIVPYTVGKKKKKTAFLGSVFIICFVFLLILPFCCLNMTENISAPFQQTQIAERTLQFPPSFRVLNKMLMLTWFLLRDTH